MSKLLSALKGPPVLHRFAAAVLVANLTFAHAQTLAAGTPAPTETAAPVTPPPTPPTKPLVFNWKLKKLDGNVNLTINPDGTYDFSGGFTDKKPGDDWDISMAVKSTTGSVVVFHWEGNAAGGIQFSKTGSSAFIADDFADFAKKHTWDAHYDFHLTAAAREQHYKEAEAKRKKLHEEEEAAIKAHNEQLMKQKEQEERAEATAEYQWELAHQPQPAPSQGGGSSASGTVSTIESVVSGLGSAVGDIAACI
jgi:hypothetical protein